MRLWHRRNLESRTEEICSKVDLWKQTEKWKTGFEPQPYTWLNGYEYDDDVPSDVGHNGTRPGGRISKEELDSMELSQ